jgi:hypothetical protein
MYKHGWRQSTPTFRLFMTLLLMFLVTKSRPNLQLSPDVRNLLWRSGKDGVRKQDVTLKTQFVRKQDVTLKTQFKTTECILL